MSEILISQIRGLVQVREHTRFPIAGEAMDELPIIENAFLLIRDGLISAYGSMDQIPVVPGARQIDGSGKFVFPSFVDSHTHLVFADYREEEMVLKLKGASYADIAARGGGILNSARKLQAMGEEELFERSLVRAHEIIQSGTGAVEIKSGYGLTIKDELKMLRVARRIGRETSLTVKTTFLGAHAVPAGIEKEDYVKVVIDEMLPAVAAEGLADYIDVFCEQGFFSVEDTIRIAEAGKRFGLLPRIHANQLHRSGGVQAAVNAGAVSADHLEQAGEEEIALLKNSSTMATLLPGAAFFLHLPYPPAREMIRAGLPVAIASDYNPGSSPSGNMSTMLSLACLGMRLTPAEAINATTINTACTLQLQESVGSITVGKKANVFITKPMSSIAFLPYRYGSQLVDQVILEGKVLASGA